MDDNFNNSSMAGKVVSVLIALLFIVVLAFPIANSLGNTDNGGGGSGESEKVVLNTLDDAYNTDLTPYKTYQYYDSSATSSLPNEITYTLDDLNELQSSLPQEFSDDFPITVLECLDETESGIKIEWSINASSGGVHTIEVWNMTNGSGSFQNLANITSFELSLSTDYSLDCTYEYTFRDTPNSVSVQKVVKTVTYISESEDGWIPIIYGANPYKIAINSQMKFITTPIRPIVGTPFEPMYGKVILTEDMFSENHLRFTVNFDNGDTSDFDLEIESTDIEGVYQFTDSFWDNGQVELKDANGEVVNNIGVYPTDITSYGYTQSESGSGTSVDGIAGTLIKLVPILMIIGLLMMFIIPMVYKPN